MNKYTRFTKKKDVEIVDERYLYEGFLKLKQYQLRHRLYSGKWSSILTREVLERRPVAAALPYDPVLDKVILIEQFRTGALYNANPWLLEIVAGISEEEDLNQDALIKREIQEESGLIAQSLHKIYEYWVSPGATNEYLTLYCAKVDAKNAGGIHGLQDHGEDIFVYSVSSQEAFSLLAEGEIKNSITIMALQWLQLHKNDLENLWGN